MLASCCTAGTVFAQVVVDGRFVFALPGCCDVSSAAKAYEECGVFVRVWDFFYFKFFKRGFPEDFKFWCAGLIDCGRGVHAGCEEQVA